MITPIDLGIFSLAFVLIFLWAIFWKGWALWIAARKGHSVWFLVILVVNLFGILEIIYIFKISKSHKDYPFKESIQRYRENHAREDANNKDDFSNKEEVKTEEVIENSTEQVNSEENTQK